MKKLIPAAAVFFLSMFSLFCCSALAFEYNPGCDADVKSYGVNLITDQDYAGLNRILLTKDTKWWIYDVTAYDMSGGFINGDEELAAFLKSKAYYDGVYTPDCFNNGSLEVNPGCDADVNASGISTIFDNFLGDPYYQALLVKAKKWWIYDARLNGWTGGYLSAGDDISAVLMNESPACIGGGSFEINAGCDEDVQATGIDTITPENFVGPNQILLINGLKWWIYDTTAYAGAGGFVDGGSDLSAFLKDQAYSGGQYYPDCFGNGSLELNPGCDLDVQSAGIDTVANNFLGNPGNQVLLTKGAKWWVYDSTAYGGAGGYVTVSDNISALFSASLPICNVTLCSKNSDCGNDGYIGVYFCRDGNVNRNYRAYMCINPGSGKSKCQDIITPVIIDVCGAYEHCVESMSQCVADACPDGTEFGQCSISKPLYCVNGILVSNCTTCGCPTGQQCINATCVGSGTTTTTTTTIPNGTTTTTQPTIDDEIQQAVENLQSGPAPPETEEEVVEKTISEMSKIIEALDLLVSKIDDPEQIKTVETSKLRILEIIRSLESLRRAEKAKGLGHRIKWFFGLAAKEEKEEARFLEARAAELLEISENLKPILDELEDVYTRNFFIGEIARLKVQSNELNIIAAKKRENAYGLFSMIRYFFVWLSKLISGNRM